MRLDWRLFARSLQQSSGAAWVAIAATLIALATMGDSAYRLGIELRSQSLAGETVRVVVNLRLWAAFALAFGYALTTGELPVMRLLLADLAVRPVSRQLAFLALQAISIAGRHACALLSVGLPLLIMLGAWLDGVQLVIAIVAVFVLMRLPVPLLMIGSRLAAATLATAVTAALAITTVLVVFWLTAPGFLFALLPPALVAQILLDGPAPAAWAGLAAWTAALAAVEFLSMRLEAAPVPEAAATAPRDQPVPAGVRLLSRLFACSPILLHGELVRLSRWRRHQFSWLMGAGLILMLGARLADPGVLRIVILLLLPVYVGGSTLANLFAVDRAGFQAFALSPLGMDAVIRAKVTATLLITLIAEAAVVGMLAAREVPWPPVGAGLLLAGGMFAWIAAIGMITSTLFPSPSDPRTVGGSLVNTSAFALIAVGGMVYVGAAAGLALLVDTGRVSLAVSALAALGLASAAVLALTAASRISARLITVRLEAIVSALTTDPGSAS